jgi:RimJ/RimL family protein N-acetyltransferase
MIRRSEILGPPVVIAAETAGASAVDADWLPVGEGLHVAIGPLSSGDEGAITSWFAGLGPETRYSRFFSPLKRLDRRLQSALACVDHVDHEAIVARSWDGATVGIARYIRLGQSRTAEVAVAVADAWRGRGIATTLLERVATRARAVGIERLVATCLSRNEPVIRLLSRLGETTIGPSDVGLVDVRIVLTRRPFDGAERCIDGLGDGELSGAVAKRDSVAVGCPAT